MSLITCIRHAAGRGKRGVSVCRLVTKGDGGGFRETTLPEAKSIGENLLRPLPRRVNGYQTAVLLHVGHESQESGIEHPPIAAEDGGEIGRPLRRRTLVKHGIRGGSLEIRRIVAGAGLDQKEG
jgi:hypothetical protein